MIFVTLHQRTISICYGLLVYVLLFIPHYSFLTVKEVLGSKGEDYRQAWLYITRRHLKMSEPNLTTQPDHSEANWEDLFLNTFTILTSAIIRQINQLNLEQSCSIYEVRNDIFLLIQDLINHNKLIYENIGTTWIFINIKDSESQEPIRNFKAWLRQVVLNYLKGRRKKQNKHERREIDIDNYRNIPSSDTPSNYIRNAELREKIQTLLDSEQSRIIEMFYFEELNYEEIADRLETEGMPRYSQENLRKKKQRAIERLRLLY